MLKGLPSIIVLLILSTSFAYSSINTVFRELRYDFPSILRCWSERFQEHSEFPLQFDGDIPVVLIHGYLHDISGWSHFRNRLSEARIGPIYVPRLTNSSGDIRRSAKEIASVVEYVLRETGKDQLILIGHSMGGIVAAYTAQNLVKKGAIKAVITLASPLRGTRLAFLGFGKASQQMSLKSPLLKNLTAQMIYHPKTNYFCMGSQADEVIKPCENSFYKTPRDSVHFYLYSDVGHQSFLLDDDVIDEVISMIHALDDGRGGDHSKVLVWLRKPFN